MNDAQSARERFRAILESGVAEPIATFLIGEGLASPMPRRVHVDTTSHTMKRGYLTTEYRPHEPYFCQDRTYSLRVRELVEAESKRVHPMPVGQGGYPFQKENYRLKLPNSK